MEENLSAGRLEFLRDLAARHPDSVNLEGGTVLALLSRLEQAEQDRVKLRNRLDAMRRQRDGYQNQLRKARTTKEKTMPNQPPLNPDALEAACVLYGELADCSDPRNCDECKAEILPVIRAYLAVAQPEVNSVEQWDALPIGTMVRVHFNGNSELIIRCPAGSGAGIGGMSFIGGRHWSDVFTVWNADKLEIKCVPAVES